MFIEFKIIPREDRRATDYTIHVDGVEVGVMDANGGRRGYRIYGPIACGYRLPVRDPRASIHTGRHLGADVETKAQFESRVVELIEQGAPLTPERMRDRAERLTQGRAQWAHDMHNRIAEQVVSANGAAIWETLKGTIPGAPLMVRREPAALVREIESIIQKKRDEYDSAFADPRSVESYNFGQHASSNL